MFEAALIFALFTLLAVAIILLLALWYLFVAPFIAIVSEVFHSKNGGSS